MPTVIGCLNVTETGAHIRLEEYSDVVHSGCIYILATALARAVEIVSQYSRATHSTRLGLVVPGCDVRESSRYHGNGLMRGTGFVSKLGDFTADSITTKRNHKCRAINFSYQRPNISKRKRISRDYHYKPYYLQTSTRPRKDHLPI